MAEAAGAVAVTGSTGLVGSAVVGSLEADGRKVLPVMRSRRAAAKAGGVYWDPESEEIDAAALEGVPAVVHLAGDNISKGRWTRAKKARIRDSRVEGTALLAETLAKLEKKPEVLVCASAVGYYGHGHEPVDEIAPPGEDFLASVCRRWEEASRPAEEAGIRVVRLRFGVILSSEGGALQAMLPPFKLGIGGPLGSGEQWMSWVHIDDAVGAVRFVLDRKDLKGAYNVTAPNPATNAAFSRELGAALGKHTFPVGLPSFVVRLGFGKMADSILLNGQRVLPRALEKAGYRFRHPDLAPALAALLK